MFSGNGFTCDIWATMKTLIQVPYSHRRLYLVIYVYAYTFIRAATIHEEIGQGFEREKGAVYHWVWK